MLMIINMAQRQARKITISSQSFIDNSPFLSVYNIPYTQKEVNSFQKVFQKYLDVLRLITRGFVNPFFLKKV